MSRYVLILNAGSSSLKFRVYELGNDAESWSVAAGGQIEGIGTALRLQAKDGGGEVKQVYSREGDRLIIEATFEGEVAAKTEKLRFVYDRRE